MAQSIAKPFLEAYSRGEITRKEIQEQTGEPVTFGRLLRALHEHNLTLPRIPADPAKVEIVKQLFDTRPHVG